MAKILIPASSPEDWKQFLTEPEKHWKSGYSARSLAYCWHELGEISHYGYSISINDGFFSICY